jgi:hypothetical protein
MAVGTWPYFSLSSLTESTGKIVLVYLGGMLLCKNFVCEMAGSLETKPHSDMHFGFQMPSLFFPFFWYHLKRMFLFGWCLTSSSLFFIGEISLNFFS